MNKAYAINYDLKIPGRNYSGLYEGIKEYPRWCHYLESTWLIITDETPKQVWDKLGKNIDKNDYMLIIEVTDKVYGWLPDSAWKWINDNVPSKAQQSLL